MATTSFIKIFGPPVLSAIKELQKIAVDMPEVCVMDSVIAGSHDYETLFDNPSHVAGYYQSLPVDIEVERCNNIISKSGEKLGEYDFFFEWFTEPTMNQLNTLIEKIDEKLAPLGSRYTITTKK